MSENKDVNNTSTILVVDDDRQIVQLLRDVLTRAGYQVLAAGDGGQALETAAETEPGLILMDIMMPGMDGFETTMQLKRHPHLFETPVIFLSGRADEEDRGRAFWVGASMFVRKPFTANELLEVVDFALRARLRLHPSTP